MTHDDDPLLADDERKPEDIERGIHRTRANLSDTLDAISSRLTPGQMVDQAMQYMRTSLPADFGSNLAESVRNNPMPVALIGVGIAWMAISGRRGSMPRQSWSAETSRYATGPYETGPHETGPYDRGLGDATGTGYGAPSSGLGATGSTATGTGGMHASGAGTGGPSSIDTVRDKARDLKQQAQAGLGTARERVASTMSSTASSARESMAHLSERSAQTYARARDSFTQIVDEQPLILGALGIAVGAALGAALPRTRQEDQLLGETRDDLLQRASSTARTYATQAADQAADKARTAMQTVTEKAHRALDERSSQHATASTGGGSSTADRPSVSGEAAARAGVAAGTSGGTGSSASSDRPGANANDDAVTIRTTNVRAASSSTNDERPV